MVKNDFKIAFVQETRLPQIGIMNISAVLKEQGFLTDIFSLAIEKEALIENILDSNPDMVGLSAMSTNFKTMMEIVTAIKKRNPEIFTIIGGIHATLFPETLLQEKDLDTVCPDAICMGEGEYAMLELALSLKRGELNTDIKNLWLKKNGKIIKNEPRPLITDLDSLPFPDRDTFFKKYPPRITDSIKFMSTRGCLFNCSYCYNKGIKEFYKGKGHWVRFKSSKRMIEEIKEFNKKHPIKWISFVDDTFNTDKKRLKEFLEMYKKEINIPFTCQLKVDLADEEQIELLHQAGVNRISIGLEHGDEEFRKKVLYRYMTNKQILDFGKWLRKRKIRLFTHNIIGFPAETLDMAFSTVELNAKLKPELAIVNILNPFPKTAIYEYAKDNGYLSDKFDFDYLIGYGTGYNSGGKIRSAIKNENMPKLINLRCFFMLLVFYPWLKPVVKILIRFPHNALYEFIWKITGFFRINWRFVYWPETKASLKEFVVSLKNR